MCGFFLELTNGTDDKLITRPDLNHRGPDEHVVSELLNGKIEYFRLSIMGGTEGSSPVISDDRDWTCYINGEIYNFKALQNSYNLKFSNSDTKTVVNGLEKHGLNFLRSLRGVFSGVIVHSKTNSVYIIRDPLGEKPLYVHESNQRMVFSSEFVPLYNSLSKGIDLNFDAIESYFRFSYIEEPGTIDNRIRHYPKGIVSRVNIPELKLEQLIDLNAENYEEVNMTYSELTRVLFDEVLHSDVRNGLALSSGVDSNSIFHELLRRDLEINPLIVNFPNSPSISEFEAAVSTCEKYKVPFIEILGNRQGSLLQGLRNLTQRNDGPHADPSGFAYLNIFKGAQENGIKVVQLGHGPDELFWGYEYLVKQNLKARVNSIDLSLKHFWNSPADATRILSRDIKNRGNPIRSLNSSDPYLSSSNQWVRTRAEIVHSYLSANGLRQSDRLAMSFSVEPRTVYADFRLYRWTQSNLFNDNEFSRNKAFFRESAYFGNERDIRVRPKLGFSSDYGQWFNDSSIKSELDESIMTLRKAGILEPCLKFPPWSRTHEKYRVLMLGMWLQEYGN